MTLSVSPNRTEMYEFGADVLRAVRDVLGAFPLNIFEILWRSMHDSNQRYNDISVTKCSFQ